MNDDKYERLRMKARALRYQKPIASGLNFFDINDELYNISDECYNIQWMSEDDVALARAFEGDEDDMYQFREEFSMLVNDCNMMREEINKYNVFDQDGNQEEPSWYDEPSEVVPPAFDIFFPAIGANDLMGYDSFEEEYSTLTYYEVGNANKYAREKLKRMTKDDLLDCAGLCMRILQLWTGIKYRYHCLKTAMEILTEQQETLVKLSNRISELYLAAETATEGFKYKYKPEVAELDRALMELPEQYWLE